MSEPNNDVECNDILSQYGVRILRHARKEIKSIQSEQGSKIQLFIGQSKPTARMSKFKQNLEAGHAALLY